MNKFIFSGFLGNDPDFSITTDGLSIAKFNVAVRNYDFKRKEAVTMWIRVIVFGNMAEKTEKHFSKGSPVEVCGRLEEYTWTPPGESVPKKLYNVIADTVDFTPSKKDNGSNSKPNSSDDEFDPF